MSDGSMDERVVTLEIAVQQFMKELGIPGRRQPLYDGAVAHYVEKFVQNAGAKRHGGCRGVAGWLLGHQLVGTESYRERTTPLPSSAGPFHESKYEGPLPPPNEYTNYYHGHVCTRCGLVVNTPVSVPTSPRGRVA